MALNRERYSSCCVASVCLLFGNKLSHQPGRIRLLAGMHTGTADKRLTPLINISNLNRVVVVAAGRYGGEGCQKKIAQMRILCGRDGDKWIKPKHGKWAFCLRWIQKRWQRWTECLRFHFNCANWTFKLHLLFSIRTNYIPALNLTGLKTRHNKEQITTFCHRNRPRQFVTKQMFWSDKYYCFPLFFWSDLDCVPLWQQFNHNRCSNC